MNSVSKIALAVAFAASFSGTAQAGPIDCPDAFTRGYTITYDNFPHGPMPSSNRPPAVYSGERHQIYSGTIPSPAFNACQYITSDSTPNIGSVANINAEGFFGHSDWMSVGQNEIDVGRLYYSPEPYQLSESKWLIGSGYYYGQDGIRGSTEGLWSIPGADFENFEYLLALTSGNDRALAVFLLDGSTASGGWQSYFTISHTSSPDVYPWLHIGVLDVPSTVSTWSLPTTAPASHYTFAMRAKSTEATDVPEPFALGFLAIGTLGLFAARRYQKNA